MQIPIKTEEKQKVNVCFPDESFISIDYTYDGHPAFAIINESLRQFEFKDVFGWNLSIVFELVNVSENGMPVGDEVKAGDTVVVLEAMKMANNLEAENDGKVTAVLVKEGDSVMEDTPLVVIE